MAHGSRSSADSARKQRVQEAFLLNYTKFEKKNRNLQKTQCALSGEKSKKMATCLGHLSGSQFRRLFMVEAACSASSNLSSQGVSNLVNLEGAFDPTSSPLCSDASNLANNPMGRSCFTEKAIAAFQRRNAPHRFLKFLWMRHSCRFAPGLPGS